MKSTMFRHVLIVPLACTAWLAGCGDDDTESASTQGMTTPTLGDVVVVESSLTHNAVTLRGSLVDWGWGSRCMRTLLGNGAEPHGGCAHQNECFGVGAGQFRYSAYRSTSRNFLLCACLCSESERVVYSAQVQFTTLAESPELMGLCRGRFGRTGGRARAGECNVQFRNR